MGQHLPIWQNLQSLHKSTQRYASLNMLPSYHRISDKDLDEFIAIYKEEFGEELNRAEAGEMASRLVTLYELLARKVPEKEKAPSSTTQHDDDRLDGDHPRIGFQT